LSLDREMLDEPEINVSETVGRLLGIIARRRWWIVIPACVTLCGTLVVLSRIPNRYTSEATLLVVQQQVPQRYVVSTTTTDIREALQATTQEVLSRTRLLGIMDEFGLYTKEKQRLSPEALLELMRRDIHIDSFEGQAAQKDVNSFKISFAASNPRLAQEVTSKLTSLFIEQNEVTREHQATTTTNFLREQLEAAKKKLADSEEEVRGFKMQHLGELPEQQPGNVAILNGLQSELQNAMTALSRAQEQREYLQSLIGYRALLVDGDLARLKSERAALMERYTAKHPAVKKIDEKIADTQTLLNTLRTSPSQGGRKPLESPTTAIGGEHDASLALQLKSQLESNKLEIENLLKEQKRLKTVVEQYQMRLNQTPVREQQLSGLLRNYDQLKLDYADKLSKETQARMAADLEKRQEGQQFRVVDQPSLPTIPITPNRLKMSLGGAGAGFLLGFIVAFCMEFQDHSFRSEKELKQQFSTVVVVGIPLLSTPGEIRASARNRTVEWIVGSALGLGMLAAEMYEFFLYRHAP
jgi:succinoglycan biosynthesis transport protein ExoP